MFFNFHWYLSVPTAIWLINPWNNLKLPFAWVSLLPPPIHKIRCWFEIRKFNCKITCFGNEICRSWISTRKKLSERRAFFYWEIKFYYLLISWSSKEEPKLVLLGRGDLDWKCSTQIRFFLMKFSSSSIKFQVQVSLQYENSKRKIFLIS